MRILDWIRERKKANQERRAIRVEAIMQNLEETAANGSMLGLAREFWQMRMNPADAYALTGKRFQMGQFFRAEVSIGSVRVLVCPRGDLPMLRETVTY